jgi:hypothetical protein
MKLDEKALKAFQQHVGYNDEEMKRFRDNPRNEDVLTKSVGLMNKTIVAKVVESRGAIAGTRWGISSISTEPETFSLNLLLKESASTP